MTIAEHCELCWICQLRVADSYEHKIKASILKRHFGKRYDKNPMIYGQGERMDTLDTYKSKLLMFPKVICHDCNVVLTRPHDDAYDMFNEYIGGKYECLEQTRQIDFMDIFGEAWAVEKINLFKYFAKHAGCKVATSGIAYCIEGLASFIKGLDSIRHLKIVFELNEGMKEAYDVFKIFDIEAPYIGNTQTIWFDDDLGFRYYAGKIVYQWMSVVWIQGERVSSGHNYLKSSEPLSIKYFKDSDSVTECKNGIEAYHRILYSGMTSIDESRKYYLNLLNNISV
jgi:hypothetical protein